MPETVAFSSQGTQLKIKIGATYTVVTGVEGLSVPSIKWDMDDITNLGSPDKFKEKKTILKDPGAVSYECIYNPADPSHQALRTANATGDLKEFQIVLSDEENETHSFKAYVTDFAPKAEKGKAGRLSVELTPSGPITVTTTP